MEDLDIPIDRDPTDLDIKFEDATRFLNKSMHNTYVCVVCKGGNFEIPSIKLNDGNVYAGRSQIALTGSKVAMAAIPVTCGNCGEARLVAVHIAQAWLADNPAESE